MTAADKARIRELVADCGLKEWQISAIPDVYTAQRIARGLAWNPWYSDEQVAESAARAAQPPRDPIDVEREAYAEGVKAGAEATGKQKPKRERKPSQLASAGGPVAFAAKWIAEHAMHADGPTLRRWRGDWYQYEAARGHYVVVSDDQLDARLYREGRLSRRQDVGDVRHALIAADDVLVDHAELGTWLGDPVADLANPIDIAACPNGLIHLPTRKLIPASPRYFATTALGVKYDPAAQACTRWLAFLGSLWEDDPQSIEALQEWFGYMLTADTRQQKILLLVGPKRSGKGTIMWALESLIGHASVAAPTLASLGTNFGLWPLIGKTAAIIGDARLGGRSDIAQIVERLLSISGEDAITIDRKHRDPWTGRLSTRISVVSNELPRFTDASDAIVSRFLILELSRSWYGKEDTGLKAELAAELPGILLWAIEGWHRLRERGRFVQPETSRDTITELADLASPVSAWVRERCSCGYGVSVDCSVAYEDFKRWAEQMGHHVPSQATFGRDLKASAQTKRQRVRTPLGFANHYMGLELKS